MKVTKKVKSIQIFKKSVDAAIQVVSVDVSRFMCFSHLVMHIVQIFMVIVPVPNG